jgi:hypothetical protein
LPLSDGWFAAEGGQFQNNTKQGKQVKISKLMVVGIASIMAATCGMADDSMKRSERSEPVMQ